MRALTLKPHWAHAVAHLGKRCENRSRPIPPALVGQRIAIHAGATLPKPWHGELWRAGGRHPGIYRAEQVPTRVIVATAVLEGCVGRDAERYAAGWMTWGDFKAEWWWHLADVRTLDTPIAHERGQLGLWRLPPDTHRALARFAE